MESALELGQNGVDKKGSTFEGKKGSALELGQNSCKNVPIQGLTPCN